MEHQPADGSFDDPSSFEHAEASFTGVTSDALGVDAEGGGVLDELVLEALIVPGLGCREMNG